MCKYTGGTIVRMTNEQIGRNSALTNLLGSLSQATQAVSQAKMQISVQKTSSYGQHNTVQIVGSSTNQPRNLHQYHHDGVDISTDEEYSIGDSSGEQQPHQHQKQSSIATRVRRKRQVRDHNKPEGSSAGHQSTVQHHYHDFAASPLVKSSGDGLSQSKKSKGGIAFPFPSVLHAMLERAEVEGFDDIVSWQSHGRAFMVHSSARFVKEIMPLYFRQTRFASFQRQLSLYGFLRLTRKGIDHGAYYHELFVRGRSDLCQLMQRTRVKGSWVRQSSSPETEPDFASMPLVPKSTNKILPKLPPLRKCTSAGSKTNSTRSMAQAHASHPDASPTSSNYTSIQMFPASYPSPTAPTGFGWTNSSLLSMPSSGGQNPMIMVTPLPQSQPNQNISVASSQARASSSPYRSTSPQPTSTTSSRVASDMPIPMNQYFEPPPQDQAALAAFLCDVGLDSDEELQRELSQYDTEPLPWNGPTNYTEL